MKRIAALQDQGRRVIGFTFHRIRDKPDVPPGWQNVHLGTTYNRRYLQRLCALAKAVGVLCVFFRIAGGGGVEGGETALRAQPGRPFDQWLRRIGGMDVPAEFEEHAG